MAFVDVYVLPVCLDFLYFDVLREWCTLRDFCDIYHLSPMESLCIIVIEERTPKDDITSIVSIMLDNRLTPSLDSIIDRNTQLLFDQDSDNAYEYKASLVDKVMMISILACIRSSGWDWATSNGYSEDGEVVRNFYFEKKVDLSKMKRATAAPKRSGRKVLHFGATGAAPSSACVAMTASVRDCADRTTPKSQTPPPPGHGLAIANSPKQRRASSVHDTKTANIFKHLAERRKLSQSSHHPLDLSSIVETEHEPEDHAISSASAPTRKKADSAPPPPPPPPSQTAATGAAVPLAENPGRVGNLKSMFENQLQFQGGPGHSMAKRRSSLAVGFKPGRYTPENFEHRFLSESGTSSTSSPFFPSEPTSLSALTTSRPVTERKRRPTPTEKHSIHISQMRRPLVPSASFEEAEAAKNNTACIPQEVDSDLLKKLVEDEAKNIVSRQQGSSPPPLTSTTVKTAPTRGVSPHPTRRRSASPDPLSAQDPPPVIPLMPPLNPPPPAIPTIPPPHPPSPVANGPPPPPPPPPAQGHPPFPASRVPPSVPPSASGRAPSPPPPPAQGHPPSFPASRVPPSVPPSASMRAPSPPPPLVAAAAQKTSHSVNPEEERLSTVSSNSTRLSAESEKSIKNAAYFKQMKDDEERQKQNKLNAMSPEELEKFLAEEEANKVHENDKVNHFAKLGKTFAVGTSKLFGRGGGGRGRGGRGK